MGGNDLRLDLSTDERLALRRFASGEGLSLEAAAKTALRDWMISQGYLELEHELDEDTETAGNA